MATGIVWDERYMWYDFGSYAGVFSNGSGYVQPGTPVETPESKRRILNLLDAGGLYATALRKLPLDDASHYESCSSTL